MGTKQLRAALILTISCTVLFFFHIAPALTKSECSAQFRKILLDRERNIIPDQVYERLRIGYILNGKVFMFRIDSGYNHTQMLKDAKLFVKKGIPAKGVIPFNVILNEGGFVEIAKSNNFLDVTISDAHKQLIEKAVIEQDVFASN